MPSFIVIVCSILLSLMPYKSMAQLDLNDLMSDSADETAETTEPDISAADEEITESTASIVGASKEIVAEKIIAETPDSETENAEDAEDSDTPEDDFMSQYIDELSEQNHQHSEARKAQSKAMDLILQKDNKAVLPDDSKELFERIEQIREEQKKLLQANKMPEIKTSSNPQEKSDTGEKKENTESAENTDTKDNRAKAPFGLIWGASKEDIEVEGFDLTPAKFEDYSNAYIVNNPQQQRAAFEKITAVFGEQNHLQMIYAQSSHIKDMPNAEKVLRLYHDYYAALERKYGNAKEHYRPNKDDSTSSKEIGNDNFLKELATQKSALFAVFDNDVITATLSIFADDEERSFITLNYENKLIRQQEREENLNELVNDL